jgi:hypothetical protein
MQQLGIAFRQCDNSFLDCAEPQRLQQLADSFGPEHIKATVEPWVARLLPFFSAAERADGYRHHLVMRQMEYCHNIIFHQKAALNKLFDRLLDHGRALGQPNKLAIIFGRSRFHVDARTGEIEEKVTRLRTPVLRATLGKNTIKQYVRAGGPLRTEAASFQLRELSLPKGIQNLPRVREVLGKCTDGTEREKSASRERVKSARRHGGAGDVFLMVSLAAPFSISFLPCLVHSRGLDGSTNIWLPIFRLLGHAFLKSFPSLSGSFRIG